MIAQTSGRSHDNMGALRQFAAFEARVHAADASDDLRTGMFIKPTKFALDLQREFARRRHDEREGR